MKKVIVTLVLLSAVLTAVAQQPERKAVRLVVNSSFGIGAGLSRLYSDFGMNEGGGSVPLLVPELEFNMWYAYVSIGGWRHRVGSPFPGVDEKVGTAFVKFGPLLRVGEPNRCVTLAPYVGRMGCFSSWDVGTETVASRNHRSSRWLVGVRVGLTRRYVDFAIHASTSECGLSVMWKFDEED